MAAPTAAELAAKLKGDNRTVVGSKSPTDAANDFVATDVGPEGATYGDLTAKTADAAAYADGVTRGDGKITVPQGGGALTAKVLRTQYFHVGSVAGNGTYDATKEGFGAKRCFVNSKGQPLAANGTPTDVANALAVADDDTALSSLGEAVWNGAQTVMGENRTPAPGVYDASERATSLYAPYAGWTAQDALPTTP